MPFTLTCPNCDASLTAPDTVAGKRVKCKKCGEAFVARRSSRDADDDPPPARSKVAAKSPPKPPARTSRDDDEDDAPRRRPSRRPVDEEDDDDPPRKSARGGRRPVDDDEDDDRPRRRSRDEEDDDEDEPRPKAGKGKKGKKAKKGPPVLLIAGLGGVLLIGIAVAVYFIFFAGDKPEPVAKAPTPEPIVKSPAPAPLDTTVWVDQYEPDGRYHIKFPGAPQVVSQAIPTPNGVAQIKVYAVEVPVGKEVFGSMHQAIPTEREDVTDDQILDQIAEMAKLHGRGGAVSSQRPLTYQSYPGREMILSAPAGQQGILVMRLIMAKERVIVLMAGGEAATTDSPRLKTFFESLKIE